MHEMSVIWLRIAALLYAVGLLHSFLATLRKSRRLFPVALGTFCVGVVLHLVSIVEESVLIGNFPANNFYQSISLFGFLIAVAFVFVYWRYRFESLSPFIFPVVFLMTFIGSMGTPVAVWSDTHLRDTWLLVHVVLILAGYSALLLTAVASVIYLVQEWQLKSKKPRAFYDRLPPLLTLDDLISRAMAVGFVLLTLGVVVGSSWAFIESGTKWISNPRVAIFLFTWAFYLVMVFLRYSAGWRGRKAAIMVLCVVGFFAMSWAAHTGFKKLLLR